MHQRNRTWMIGSDPVERVRQRTMAIEGGDGSTLNLDFTSGVLDPRLTFRRGSNATFINSSGYVEWTKSNLWLRSNELASASWTALNVTRVSSTDPNDGNTATEIIETAVNNVHALIQAVGSIRGMRYTASVYMKKGVNRTVGWIRDNNLGSDALIFYTLTGSGSFSIANGSYGITGSIERVGTGDWYRCIFSVTCATGADANIQLGTAENTIYGSWSFLGVVGNSIHVWGAQAEMGFVARPLIVTTSTAKYDDPRFDYSLTTLGQIRGLLNESQVQNALYYSENITGGAWTIQALPDSYSTVSITNGIAPNNTNTANLLTEGTGNWSRSIYQFNSAAAGTYTYSVWVKAISGNTRFVRLVLSSGSGDFVYVTVNMSTGAVTQAATFVGTASAPSATVTPYPGSWYRIALTGTLAASRSFVFIVPADTATPAVSTTDYGRLGYVGTGAQFAVWGAQVEAGSGASSYIPTGATQVTRTPDLLAVTNTTNMGLNTSAGTFFVETELPRSGITSPAQFGAPYANGSWLGQFYGGVDATTLTASWWGGSGLSLSRSGNPKSLTALSYGLYTGTSIPVSSSLNGAVSTGTFTTSGANNAPNPATWNFIALACNTTTLAGTSRDNLNACIKRFKYYPTRLTDTQLQALTAT